MKSIPRLSPRWTDENRARVLSGIDRRAKRRSALRLGSVALGAVVLAALVARFVPGRSSPGASPSVAELSAARPPTETTSLLEPNSEVAPEPGSRGRAFRLVKGAVRFTVVHDAARPFRVKVGSAVLEDLGTVFTVRRLSATNAELSVTEGRVRVSALDASFEVGPSERRTFVTDVEPVDAAVEPEARAARAKTVPSWRPLAESGRFGDAYVALKATGPNAVHDETGELLLAADVARLSGHPADAVPYLERILTSRGSDPRAGLSAFTLGRVFLEELGRPAEAATAFARARRAGGPLAEDALAREVEASSRAGETGRARSLALEYQKRYPNGRRLRRVVKFGGLD